MMMNSHRDLAINFIENLDEGKKILIKEKHFLWGNLKPDCASKYKLNKHYFAESFGMIITKIIFLSTLSIEEIYEEYSINKFNQELGVICHFLCDYFCVPHNQRWEFKRAMKSHIIYEKNLAKYSKGFNEKVELIEDMNIHNIAKYLISLQREYEKKVDYTNDLVYANVVCQTVINLILNEVVVNERQRNKIMLVV